MSEAREARLVSAESLLSKHITVLERRQEARRAYLREVEALIERRDLEIANLKARLAFE